MRVSTMILMLLAGAPAFGSDEGKADLKINDRRIDYIEFHATDLARTKAFYTGVFGWKFTDYGPDYIAFDDGRITGGFWKEGSSGGGPLGILYAVDLAAPEARIPPPRG